MKSKNITFEQVSTKWDILWPGRNHPRFSSMTYQSGSDKNIKKYPVTYLGVFYNDELIGVNSGHKTSDTYYRSRGLWVDPKHRGMGVAKQLLEDTLTQAMEEKCRYVWTCPRKGSEYAYLSVGFKIVSEWKEMDYGLNAYAILDLC